MSKCLPERKGKVALSGEQESRLGGPRPRAPSALVLPAPMPRRWVWLEPSSERGGEEVGSQRHPRQGEGEGHSGDTRSFGFGSPAA